MPEQISSAPHPRTWPRPSVLGQVLGLAAFVGGLGWLAGVAVALLVGGLVLTGWCALVESAELRTPRARPSGGE